MKTASATAAAITGTVAALCDRELLAQTSNLARVERHLQGAIIDHLAEIEARSLFLRRGFAHRQMSRPPSWSRRPGSWVVVSSVQK